MGKHLNEGDGCIGAVISIPVAGTFAYVGYIASPLAAVIAGLIGLAMVWIGIFAAQKDF